MNDASWYEVVQGEELLQGDVLFDCPTLRADHPLPWPLPEDVEVGMHIENYDVVILTQSCDLANDKVDQVLVAYLSAWSDIVQTELARGNTGIQAASFVSSSLTDILRAYCYCTSGRKPLHCLGQLSTFITCSPYLSRL